ncbi:MAG: putative Ig domain-containing protein [Verrucomicrobiales bacterium]|nr:putative Ig domain-containing protein [Verrucomicrobiales bacterium]
MSLACRSFMALARRRPRSLWWRTGFRNQAERLRLIAAALLLAGVSSQAQEQWSSVVSGVSAGLKGVTYGSGVFVAVGADGTILRSADHGWTWQDRSDPEVTMDWMLDVAYGNGVFLATGGGSILISEDLGLTWRRAGDLADYCTGLAYGNGRWVASGEAAVWASTSNGAGWSIVYDPPEGEALGIDAAYPNNTFFVVGGSILYSSNGGQSFTEVGNEYSNWLADVAYGNGWYVAIGGVFGNLVLRSATPTTWALDDVVELEGVDGLDGIAFGNGKFVITAGEGKLLVSDGTGAWQQRSSGVSNWLKGAAYGDGTFVVVGEDGVILISGRAPEINSVLTAAGTVGLPFSYQMTALYGPTEFNATSLPGGLTINRGTGLISGTPTSAGTFTVTLIATNPYGSDTRQLTVTVQPGGSGGEFRVNIFTAVELEWESVAGKSYQVQSSPDLKAWSNYQTPIPGTGAPIQRLYSTRDPARRFYRVQEQ